MSFTKEEVNFLKKLDTPIKVQDYLESIPFNHEEGGETCMSVRRVLLEKKAHCLEGAMLACAAFVLQGRRPTIVSIKVTTDDYDHVVAIFKENGLFGAVSKTNHSVLGYRDPVYKSIRELVMSYFHEYFLVTTGKKTMRGYSRLISLNRFKENWRTSEEELFSLALWISGSYHIPVLPKELTVTLRKAGSLEREGATLSRDGL